MPKKDAPKITVEAYDDAWRDVFCAECGRDGCRHLLTEYDERGEVFGTLTLCDGCAAVADKGKLDRLPSVREAEFAAEAEAAAVQE